MRLETARQQAHAHRSGHRRRVHAHAAERSGARRRGRRVVRRVPRAQPARRHRPRVRARFAGEPRAGAARAGDVGHARWRRASRSCSAVRPWRQQPRAACSRSTSLPCRQRACRCCRAARSAGAAVSSRAIKRALAEAPGDMLVFLPGAGEIRRVQGMLDEGCTARTWTCCRSFGELAAGEQDAALRARERRPPQDRARDQHRRDQLDHRRRSRRRRRRGSSGAACSIPSSGMNRLETQRISRASAEQRAGRAGRTAPGVCLSAVGRGRRAQPRCVRAAGGLRRRSRAAGARSRGVGHGGGRACAGSTRRPPPRWPVRAICCVGWVRSMAARKVTRARPRHAGISRASAARAHAVQAARTRARARRPRSSPRCCPIAICCARDGQIRAHETTCASAPRSTAARLVAVIDRGALDRVRRAQHAFEQQLGAARYLARRR